MEMQIDNTNSNSHTSVRSNPPRLMNVAEASQYIGISDRFLRELIASKKIRAARIGKRVVLRLVDLDAWIEKQLQGGVA